MGVALKWIFFWRWHLMWLWLFGKDLNWVTTTFWQSFHSIPCFDRSPFSNDENWTYDPIWSYASSFIWCCQLTIAPRSPLMNPPHEFLDHEDWGLCSFICIYFVFLYIFRKTSKSRKKNLRKPMQDSTLSIVLLI